MATITSIEATTARVPLSRPTSIATRKMTARNFTLVRVTGDDGVHGIGFCCGGNHAGELTTEAVRQLLAPVIVGEDPFRVEGLWQEMYQEALLHGRVGSVMRAISAIDIALWDRNARAMNLPLRSLLGAVANDSVPAYVSGGYYAGDQTPADLAAEMGAFVQQGFRALKLKIGRLAPRADADRVAAVRDAVGPDVLIMLDANNAWRDLPEALVALRPLERFDPYWIEEPFSPDDVDNHVRLAERTPILVATGEIEAGRWRFHDLLVRGAAQIIQADAAVCGGITEFRRIAATAASFGVPISPHWFHDLHVHLVAATPNATFVEFFPEGSEQNFRQLIDRQLEHRDGRLLLPPGAGLGFSFDERAVQQYSTDGWA